MAEEGEVSGRRPRLFTGRRRANAVEGPRQLRAVIKHTPEEYARVKALADVQGISVPRLYERALHTGGVAAAARVSQIHDELFGVRRLLAIDSNNLNQIARVANTTGAVESEQELLATLEHLARVIDRLNDLLGRLPESERA